VSGTGLHAPPRGQPRGSGQKAGRGRLGVEDERTPSASPVAPVPTARVTPSSRVHRFARKCAPKPFGRMLLCIITMAVIGCGGGGGGSGDAPSTTPMASVRRARPMAIAKVAWSVSRVPGRAALQVPRVRRGGCHRKQLHDHVDAAEQEALLALHLGLEQGHAMEALARQLAGAAVDEA
jgi:hypothetical protein